MTTSQTCWPWNEPPETLHRWALFLDVDGTLLDIVDRPDAVHAPSELLGTLEALCLSLSGGLALVSGRRIDDLDRIFAPLSPAAAGVHGAFLRHEPGGPILQTADPESLTGLAPRLRAFVDAHPGCLLEDKGVSLAVHYRLCPSARAALEAFVTELVREAPKPIAVVPGRMVIELKASGATKGTAIRSLMASAPFAGRIPVFAGDDVTDQDGFDAVQDLGGHGIQVGQTPGVRAPRQILDPEAFRHWLGRVSGILSSLG